MVTILIVDDDEKKVAKVRKVIADALLLAQADVVTASNLYDAAKTLEAYAIDLLVLDVHVPMRKGEDAREDGGVEFLRQLVDGRIGGKPSHIVGLTAYSELGDKFRSEFSGQSWFLIQYDETSESWADSLSRRVIHVAAVDRQRRAGFGIDLAILTALPNVELDAVLALKCNWQTQRIDGDDTIYYAGAIPGSEHGRGLKVIACAASQMGMPATTALASKAIEIFRPRYLAMVGIAAGLKGNYGDILVADQTWDYGSGKSRQLASGAVEFEPAPFSIPLDEGLRAKLELFAKDRELLRGIRTGWGGDDPGTQLQAILGPVASGAAVLENPSLLDVIRSHQRKVVGIEMETYGMFIAARFCRSPRPKVLSLKSISDRGDSTKDDRYQAYAAYTSASFLHAFARAHLTE